MTLLIDADILVYKAASGNQTDIDWGGITSSETDLNGAKGEVAEKLRHYTRIVGDETSGPVVLCFGGPGNFRKGILPSYKGNRVDKARPKLIAELRKWCEDIFDCRSEPMLEGDDMLGLLWEPGDVIVSQDKDLRNVPCDLYNPNHPDKGVEQITDGQAEWWHQMQTLTGDACDGYKGCPGVGPKKAAKILGNTFFPDTWWGKIVAAYESKSLTEADALVQARVAWILRAGDYDFKTKEIKLWSPHV